MTIPEYGTPCTVQLDGAWKGPVPVMYRYGRHRRPVFLAQIWGILLDGPEAVSMRLHKRPPLFFSSAIPPTDKLNHLCFTTFRTAKMSHTNFFNTTNVWSNYTISDERSQILTWLSPLDPRLRHRDIRERRVKNVGEWLLETKEFRHWYAGDGEGESRDAVLFCYGNPGVGKTYIR